MAQLTPTTNETLERVNFTYTTSSPLTLTNLQAGDEIIKVWLVIETAFDDSSATVQVGTVATPGLIFLPGDTDISKANSQWICLSISEISVTEIFRLLISPGTSTQGSGYVLFRIRRA